MGGRFVTFTGARLHFWIVNFFDITVSLPRMEDYVMEGFKNRPSVYQKAQFNLVSFCESGHA